MRRVRPAGEAPPALDILAMVAVRLGDVRRAGASIARARASEDRGDEEPGRGGEQGSGEAPEGVEERVAQGSLFD